MSTDAPEPPTGPDPGETPAMNWTLEVVVVPVSDVDRAKAFYADQLGFVIDFDSAFSASLRTVQLTPPGSGCSICIGVGLTDMAPGSLRGLQLVVRDVRAAHQTLRSRGVQVSEVLRYGRDGTLGPADDTDDLNNIGFVFLTDPDGNKWAVQQISNRR